MDGELLRQLYRELFHANSLTRPHRCAYTDNLIVFIYFVGVLADRSMLWAFNKRNWPLWARHLSRPSYSQLMRRLRTDAIQAGISALNAKFRARLPRTNEKTLDGKPLTVGSYSRDPDATTGRLSSTNWGRGYKLHSIMDSSAAVDAFTITGLHAGEATVARELVAALDLKGALVRADANYDSNPLYAAIAQAGGRLVAPRRKPGRGLGHHRQHPHRLRAIVDLEGDPAALRTHARHRIRAEQTFGHLTNLPFGLAPLPNSVRRQHRVLNWVSAKIALYHLHLWLKKESQKAA